MWRTCEEYPINVELQHPGHILYDTLPSTLNLHLWHSSEESSLPCNSKNPRLQHILSVCKAALMQGCYTWQHARVLHKLAKILEICRLEANRVSLATPQQLI